MKRVFVLSVDCEVVNMIALTEGRNDMIWAEKA